MASTHTTPEEQGVLRLPGGLQLTAIGLLVLAVIAISIAGIVLRETEDEPVMGAPTTPQTASATAAGVTLTVPGAAFSGTGTRVTFAAPMGDAVIADARQVSIPSEAIEFTGFVTDSGIGLPPRLPLLAGEPVWLTLPPIAASGTPSVRITALDVQHADSTSERLTGDWNLSLTPPEDRTAALRTEELSLTEWETTDERLEVEILSAVRSIAETRVVMRATWRDEALVPVFGRYNRFELLELGQQTRVDPWSIDGETITVIYPRTEPAFGEPFDPSFSDWALASEPYYSAVDLHPLVADGAPGTIAEQDILLLGRDHLAGATISEKDGGVSIYTAMPDRSVSELMHIGEADIANTLVLPTGARARSSGGVAGRRAAGGVEAERDFDTLRLSDLDGLVLFVHPTSPATRGESLPGAWSGRLVPAPAE